MLVNVRFHGRIRLVDATSWLNRSPASTLWMRALDKTFKWNTYANINKHRPYVLLTVRLVIYLSLKSGSFVPKSDR